MHFMCKIEIFICFGFPRTDSTTSRRAIAVNGYATFQDCSAIDGQIEKRCITIAALATINGKDETCIRYGVGSIPSETYVCNVTL